MEFWQGLTYTKKTYSLVVIFISIMIIGYTMIFSDTIELFSEVKQKQEKLNWLKEKEKEIPVLQSQMALLDKAYLANDSSSIRDQLTEHISDFAEKNNSIVTEIPKNEFYTHSQLNVQTNQFIIKGNYFNLLKLLRTLEIEYRYSAKVVSAKFYSVKDIQTKQTHLYLSLLTQTFQQQSKK